VDAADLDDAVDELSPEAGLLRPRRQRPCRRSASKKRDELAAFHSRSSRASDRG